MKKGLYISQFVLSGLTILALIAAIIQTINIKDPIAKQINELPGNGREEEFDPSLSQLNSTGNIVNYCDSIYQQQYKNSEQSDFTRNYTEIVSQVIRKRFYHGYSYYGLKTNYLAFLFSKATNEGYRAIIVPDDILKYPVAACSQQSLVMMEVLHKKNITTRKVGFQGQKSGHFCFEVFYNDGWHFYDTNMEPDQDVLNAYNRPDIATLSGNKDLLLKAYKNYPEELILDVFSSYTYGPVNAFPAPRGIVFQRVTLFLSYTLWLFFLVLYILVRRRYLRLSVKQYVRNRRIYFPQSERGTSPSYYPGFTAPGA